MSYRNEVAIVFDKSKITKEDIEAIMHLFKKLKETHHLNNVLTENERYIQFFDNFIKWDETEQSVYAIINFLNLLEDNSYTFLRVGEEIGDFEFKGSPDFGLSLLYQIDVNSLPLQTK